jgi:hypothetical protein
MARYSPMTLMCAVLAQGLAKRGGFIFSGVHNINDDNLSEGPELRNVAVASGSLDWESLMININRKAFDDLSFIG